MQKMAAIGINYNHYFHVKLVSKLEVGKPNNLIG